MAKNNVSVDDVSVKVTYKYSESIPDRNSTIELNQEVLNKIEEAVDADSGHDGYYVYLEFDHHDENLIKERQEQISKIISDVLEQ